MLGHISFGVADLARTKNFYDAVMAALGYACVYADDRCIGYGYQGTDQDKLLFRQVPGPVVLPAIGFHLCFDAADHAAVDRFHGAGVASGGTDNGQPGLRPEYGPDYYAAFLVDPNGYQIEAKAVKPA